MKAIAMGRNFQPPEQADSWGEFHARLEQEAAADGSWLGVWWTAGGLLFACGLISSAYAFEDHHWWLWLVMLTSLASAGYLAMRAMDRAERLRARAGELEMLENAWTAHVESHSPMK
jgi:hypothetical protein